MKTRTLVISMKNILGFLVILILLFSFNAQAQNGIQISLSGYPGYTFVNFEEALGYDDDYMSDWDQFSYGFSLKGLLAANKPFSYGAEVGWQRLYYAYYIIPQGDYSAYREFNVSTISVMALVRYSMANNFFALAGAGIHIFGDGIAPAIYVEPGYMISISDKLKIPVSIRLYPVFGDGIPTSISVGVGVNYSIK
jgi:hypothetical protein